jgi:hypothetical protein
MDQAADTPSPTARSRGTSTRRTADRLAALCQRLWVVGAFVLGVVVVEAVALGAVVLGTVPAGAVVGATPTGAVVVGADAGGDIAEVPGARGAGAADCPTITPTDVLAPRCGWLPSRLASGRPAAASTVVTAPIAVANTTAAAAAIRCQRIGEDAHDSGAGEGPEDPEEGGDDGAADRGERAAEQVGNAELLHTSPGCRGGAAAVPRCVTGRVGMGGPAAASRDRHPGDEAPAGASTRGRDDQTSWGACSPATGLLVAD